MLPRGYISASGNLVFLTKTAAELGIDAQNSTVNVGIPEGKRQARSLYLVAAGAGQDNTFQLEKAAKGYTLALPFILQKSGVDFSTRKYSFLIELFTYEGSAAFELQLQQEAVGPKAPYMGKPRGRKPRATAVE